MRHYVSLSGRRRVTSGSAASGSSMMSPDTGESVSRTAAPRPILVREFTMPREIQRYDAIGREQVAAEIAPVPPLRKPDLAWLQPILPGDKHPVSRGIMGDAVRHALGELRDRGTDP
jgi:hypothetical protein